MIIKNKKKIFNLRMFNKLLFALIITASICYLKGTNDLSINGFRMQELRHGISQINTENSDYELKIMDLESLNNLEKKIKELNMVAVGEISYITSFTEDVARK